MRLSSHLPPDTSMPNDRFRSALRICFACLLLGALLACGQPERCCGAELTGKQIFASTCAGCHGGQGEGTDRHKSRLEGDLSVAQLAELIRETMPEDDPGSLSAAQAKEVASFVHASFYSAVARQRNRPARVELARLTVSQYRNAVLDLLAGFRGETKRTDERGLQGEYYRGRRIGGRRDRAAARVDRQVDFDFGKEAPVPEIKEPHQFSIRWEGSVLAAETGTYEFTVRTEHAARLWVNDRERPLIDAWVKSGDDTQFQATLYLLGGRAYPLRLEFTKAKQGVDDSKKQKKPPVSRPASIALLWKRPQGVVTPIPQRHLLPLVVNESYVCTTPFPPDDRSYGWVRATTVSKAWDQATTEAAIETAGYVAEHLQGLAGTRDNAPDRTAKLRAFCQKFAELAFRHRLNPAEVEFFLDRQFAATKDPALAVKRVVLLVLKSPRFLFREIGGGAEDDQVAARLAFGLWDSTPDDTLRRAAAAGQLKSREQIAAQAERMLADRRGKTKLRQFLLTWLHVERHRELNKDRERFPEFDAQAAADLRTSLELFLDEVLESSDADFRRLLSEDRVFMNARLASLYGAEPPESGFVKVNLDAGRRAGILTHPYLLSHFAYAKDSSPIHRGVFLSRGVLGSALRPPPDSFVPLAAELHPGLTTRERVGLQTKPANCMTCHGMINQLGFTLEHFDAIGRYREMDREKPIDATGSYRTRSGERVEFNGPQDLARFLASSRETQTAFTEQLFHHLVQQPVRAYGPQTLDDLQAAFEKHQFNIRKLAVEVMVATALVGREPEVAIKIEK